MLDCDLIIDAKAGTGKTTTLKKLASLVPENAKILYLVYNKKNRDEAKKEFPPNTTVQTTNGYCGSICKKTWGSNYDHKLLQHMLPK